MEKIASFQVDHLRLLRGVYVSRRDVTPSGDIITTFDIRMTEPNRQEALTPETLHAMEHLAATYLRNRPDWKDRVVYWGPMGCCTGNYLILSGRRGPADRQPLVGDRMGFVGGFLGVVAGATPRAFGDYSFMDLAGARREAARYLDEVLRCPAPGNLDYPA